jgi:phosphatidylserine/phosphatidylglycerophosphate/cardiolipin synthase-like enzyme
MNEGADRLLYCTWSYRSLLPPLLRGRFHDLDHLVRDLLASAESSLIIVAPYLSEPGMLAVRGPLIQSIQRGAWVRIVSQEVEIPGSENSRALRALFSGPGGNHARSRTRILQASGSEAPMFHAKIVVVDRARGYLGSANLSRRAFEHNFEVGVALDARQAASLHDLLSHFEATGLLKDCTEALLASV